MRNPDCMYLLVSEEVSIAHFQDPIRAKASIGTIILPCEFSTETFETPQITWYQEKAEERRLIMQYDIHNRLSSYGEFKDRVARGSGGALVLLKTFRRDSGNYSCEVEVDNEIPSWVKTTVVLDIEKESSDDPLLFGTIGRFVLRSIFWFVPVICGVLLGRGQLSPSRMSWSGMRDSRCTEQFKKALLLLVSALAMGFIFTGDVFLEIAVKNSNNAKVYNFYFVVSLITGLFGALVVVVITIVWPCLPKNCWWKRESTSINAISYQTSQDKDESAVKFIKNTELSPENTSKTVSASNVRTLKNPDEKRVIGMAWLSKDYIGLMTSSALFKVNVQNSVEEYKRVLTVDYNDELLCVGTYRSGLIMSARKHDTDPEKGYFLKLSADKETSQIFLQMPGSPIILNLWEARWDGSVYAALSNPNQVIIKHLEKDKENTEKTVWEAVLSKPECIVQNSRGQFIVADYAKSDLFVFEENGDFLTTMKVFVPKDYQCKLNGCNRLAVGSDDRIFASSHWSSDVLVFTRDFRFEGLLATDKPSSGVISCLLVHNSFLYVAFEECICAYSLPDIMLNMEGNG
ncbi:uncharacterized protein LOC135481662 [Liolophura sinensis]|uniref:uncharacterized protein LOC135481662 n=1 Tax=Liolophura sinensis TaxID=3198878 RepID=UPI0031589074